MASFKLNIAMIRGCPPPQTLLEALKDYGLPEQEEFGVLECAAAAKSVSAVVVRKSRQVVQKLDSENHAVTSDAVEKATLLPFTVRPDMELLEIYAGSARAIEDIGAFFSAGLALPTVTEMLELNVRETVERMMNQTRKFQLRSARVSDYAANSFMIGAYSPKFTDTQHGLDFLDEYDEGVTAARVSFQGRAGKVNVTLSPNACLGYSCQEEDQAETQMLLRSMVVRGGGGELPQELRVVTDASVTGD
jgi:hypothetical protein